MIVIQLTINIIPYQNPWILFNLLNNNKTEKNAINSIEKFVKTSIYQKILICVELDYISNISSYEVYETEFRIRE